MGPGRNVPLQERTRAARGRGRLLAGVGQGFPVVLSAELTCVCSLSSVFRFGLITGVFWQVIREKEEARIRVCVPLASSLVDQQQLASPSEGSWQAVLTGHPPPLGSHYTAVPSGSGFIPGPPGHGRVEVSRSGKPRNTTLPLARMRRQQLASQLCGQPAGQEPASCLWPACLASTI